MCERYGATVTRVNGEWGRAADPAMLEKSLAATPADVVAMVHGETSTGVRNPVAELAAIARKHDALTIVDAVTSFGGVQLEVGAWGIDVCYSCTQKCLGAPSGLAPIVFAPRALERTVKCPSFYFDLQLLKDYWLNRKYHHTMSSALLCALYEALTMIDEEGLEARWARHERNHRAFVEGLSAIGLSLLPPESDRLFTLNTVQDSGRRRRRRRPQAAARGVQHRDRRRPRSAGRQDLARRPDGHELGVAPRRAAARRAAERAGQTSRQCVSRSVVVQAFRPARAGRPKGLHYVAACAIAPPRLPARPIRRPDSVSSRSSARNRRSRSARRTTRRCGKEMGSYDDRALQEYVTTRRHEAGDDLRAPEPAVAFHGRRRARHQRLRAAGRLHLYNARHPAVSGRRVAAGRRARPRDRPRDGASLASAVFEVDARADRPDRRRRSSRRAAQQLAQAGGTGLGLLFLKNSRDDEAQADELGVRYASRAGWDPAGIPRMLTTLGRIEEASDSKGVPNWLETHPPPDDRVQRVQAAVREAESAGATKFTTDHDGYLQRVDGIVWGDNPEQGIVRGSSFLHKGLRFAFDFPERMDGRERADAGRREGAGRPIGDGARADATSAGTHDRRHRDHLDAERRVPADRRRPDDRQRAAGYLGTYVGTLQSLGPCPGARAASAPRPRRVSRRRHRAGRRVSERRSGVLEEPAVVPRALGRRRRTPPAQPNQLYTAQQGDTWQSIAERQSKGIIKATTLAIMNGHPVNDQPRPGERLKIVVGD